MEDYSACFHEKFILRKSINICENFKNKLSYVINNDFFWFTKNVICTTYNVLGILALISGTTSVENIFLANLKLHTFLYFKKKYTKRMNNYYKIQAKNVVCAHKFSWLVKKVIYTTYIVLGFLALLQKDRNVHTTIILNRSFDSTIKADK